MRILLVTGFFQTQSFTFNSIADIEVAFRNLLALFHLHFRPREFFYARFIFFTRTHGLFLHITF